MLLLTGFDDAFMGVARQFNTEIALYDYEKVITQLMDNMSREDAEEYFEFNMVGAWVGKQTPGFYYKEDVDALNHH